MKQIDNHIYCKKIYESFLEKVRTSYDLKEFAVAIISFQSKEQSASKIGTNRKIQSFIQVGFQVLHTEPLSLEIPYEDFLQTINTLNNDPRVLGIIVQYPIPNHLLPILEFIELKKDFDSLSTKSEFEAPVTSCEAIWRLIDHFKQPQSKIVVIGSKGFIGKGIVKMLKNRNINIREIDKEDKLILDGDIIVTATGQPGLLNETNLIAQHTLVIDVGMVFISGQLYGDVSKTAVHIPKNITPVPGGVGFLIHLILIERIIKQYIDREYKCWQLSDYDINTLREP